MRRREFIILVGGTAAGLPFPACAQQQTRLIGFLNAQTAAGFTHLVAAFTQGLNETGFVEGQNVKIEYRWADGRVDQLPALAADLIGHQPAVLVATGGAHLAAIAATTTIPIVASFGGDPVKLGFVTSLNRPGGNVTGMTVLTDLDPKRFELINETVPRGAIIGYLSDPNYFSDDAGGRAAAVKAAGHSVGREVRIVEASTDGELERAFAELAEAHVGGLVIAATPLFNNLRDHLIALTTRLRLPAVQESREFVAAGGLMSYGTNVPEAYRQIGIYAGRILKGEKIGDLPVLQPTKFDMAINLKTAKMLGIDMPTAILLRANEVIE